MDKTFLSLLSCRPDKNAHLIYGKPERFQRAICWCGADVPGIEKFGCANGTGYLPGAISPNNCAELYEGQVYALPGLVWKVSQVMFLFDSRKY